VLRGLERRRRASVREKESFRLTCRIIRLIGSSDTADKRRAQQRKRCEEPRVVLSRLAG